MVPSFRIRTCALSSFKIHGSGKSPLEISGASANPLYLASNRKSESQAVWARASAGISAATVSSDISSCVVQISNYANSSQSANACSCLPQKRPPTAEQAIDQSDAWAETPVRRPMMERTTGYSRPPRCQLGRELAHASASASDKRQREDTRHVWAARTRAELVLELVNTGPMRGKQREAHWAHRTYHFSVLDAMGTALRCRKR